MNHKPKGLLKIVKQDRLEELTKLELVTDSYISSLKLTDLQVSRNCWESHKCILNGSTTSIGMYIRLISVINEIVDIDNLKLISNEISLDPTDININEAVINLTSLSPSQKEYVVGNYWCYFYKEDCIVLDTFTNTGYYLLKQNNEDYKDKRFRLLVYSAIIYTLTNGVVNPSYHLDLRNGYYGQMKPNMSNGWCTLMHYDLTAGMPAF